MEKITRIFILTAILNSIKMDTYYVYEDYDVQFELRSLLAKMESLSIDVQRIQRKQSAMEKRCRNFPTNINTDGNNENILAIKKAFSAEKKHLRTLIQSWENTIEAKVVQKIHNLPTDMKAQCCKERSNDIGFSQNIQNASKNGNNENMLAIKKAFSTEKKHLQTMIHSWEKTIEAKGFQKIQKELSTEIKNIEEKVEQQENITSELSLQMENFKERHETLGKKLSNIETKSDSTVERIDLLSTNISSLILKSEKKVSFSVKFKAPTGYSATIYKKSTIIKFKIVDYNEGEGYNETTGIFTVPVAGVYHFIFFVQGWHEGDNVSCPDAIVGLYIDGNAMAGAVADPKHNKQFDTGGNTYTNYLSKGQKVLIGTGSNCEQHVICGHRTSFSGHLLY